MAELGGHGTIHLKRGFDPETEADAMRTALEKKDRNEIVRILTGISNSQRQMIQYIFDQKYGKNLVEELKRTQSGDFEDALVALMLTPVKYDVDELKNGAKGSKENILIEIMCTRSVGQWDRITQQYEEDYKSTIQKDMFGDKADVFQNMLISMITGRRDPGHQVHEEIAHEDAQRLASPGDANTLKKKEFVNELFAIRNFAQLKRTFEEYGRISGEPINTFLEKEMHGKPKIVTNLVDAINDRVQYFARLLEESMKGLGTREVDLIRVVISRSEIDLALIRDEYQRMYGRTLVDRIKSDTSGAFLDCLVSIVNGN